MSTTRSSRTPGFVLVIGHCIDSFGPLAGLVSEKGCVVELALSFEDAVKAAGALPSLIVLDRSPDDFDRVRFCRVVKSDPLTSSIPILITCVERPDPALADLLAAGADECIEPGEHPELARASPLGLMSEPGGRRPGLTAQE